RASMRPSKVSRGRAENISPHLKKRTPKNSAALTRSAVGGSGGQRAPRWRGAMRSKKPPSGLSLAERDAAFGQIVRRELHPHLVAGDNADEVLAHPARHVGGHLMAALDLHAKPRVGQ